jgi:hypothetical protein
VGRQWKDRLGLEGVPPGLPSPLVGPGLTHSIARLRRARHSIAVCIRRAYSKGALARRVHVGDRGVVDAVRGGGTFVGLVGMGAARFRAAVG